MKSKRQTVKGNLLDQFLEGYQAGALFNVARPEDCPYLYSSSSWTAWMAGIMWSLGGQFAPQTVQTSKGHTIKVDGQTVSVDMGSDGVVFLRLPNATIEWRLGSGTIVEKELG